MNARTNLRELASDIARTEGLSQSSGGAPQVQEILGIMGERWRQMKWRDVWKEVRCIRERAGLRSQHREKDGG